MSDRLDFLRGVNKLHAFYTEHVRMLAHAYDLSDEEAATLLDQHGFYNVARSILRPPRVDLTDSLVEGSADQSGETHDF